MAWPNSPLTSYLAGGLPAIKAADLNAFQSAINGIINATYSLLGVVVDGTGGNVVVPNAGEIALSGQVVATNPTGTGTFHGKLLKFTNTQGGAADANPPKDQALANELRALNIIKCWGSVVTDGAGGATVRDGANVLSAVPGANVIRILWAQDFADTNYCVVANASNPANGDSTKARKIAPKTYNVAYVDLSCEDDPAAVVLDITVHATGRQNT